MKHNNISKGTLPLVISTDSFSLALLLREWKEEEDDDHVDFQNLREKRDSS